MARLGVLVKLTAHPGRGDELLAILQRFAVQAEGEPGTLLYAVNRSDADPDLVWCAEVFTSVEAFETHRATETVAELLPAMGALVADREILRGDVVGAAGL